MTIRVLHQCKLTVVGSDTQLCLLLLSSVHSCIHCLSATAIEAMPQRGDQSKERATCLSRNYL